MRRRRDRAGDGHAAQRRNGDLLRGVGVLGVFETGAGVGIISTNTHYDCFQPTPCGPLLQPGDTQTEHMCRDQRNQSGQVVSGPYVVPFAFGTFKDRAAFDIAPGPGGPATTRPPGGLVSCRP